MAIKINELELQISASSKGSAKGIDELTNSLKGLREAAKGSIGLSPIARQIDKLSESVDKIPLDKLNALSVAAEKLSTINGKKIKMPEIVQPQDVTEQPSAETQPSQGLKGLNLSAINPTIQETIDSVKELNESINKATSSLGKFFVSFKRIALYRAIRGFIKALTSGLKEGMQNLVRFEYLTEGLGKSNANKVMSAFYTEWQYLKNAMGSVAITIMSYVTPAFDWLADRLVNVINLANQFISALQGKTIYKRATKEVYDYAKALGLAKKQLMGFDELNVLQPLNMNEGYSQYADMFTTEDVATNISGVAKNIGEVFSEIKNIISENLLEITQIASAASIAIGLILLSTGQAGAGVALIAAGVAGIAISSGLEDMTKMISASLAEITQMVGLYLIAVGFLVALANPSLGLSIMVAGLATSFTAAAINDFQLTNDVKTLLTKITAIAGASLLAIGLITLLTGNLPMGMGLIVAGGASLATAATINWDALLNAFKTAWEKIKKFGAEKLQALKNWGADLKETAKGWIQSLVDGLLEKWNSLKSKVVSGLGAIGQAFTSGISSVGNFFTDIFAGNFANGGTVASGQLFIAGESGAEIISGSGSGANVSNTDQIATSVSIGNENVVQAILMGANALLEAVNSKETTIELDGAILSRQIYNAMNTENTRRGTSLVQGV